MNGNTKKHQTRASSTELDSFNLLIFFTWENLCNVDAEIETKTSKDDKSSVGFELVQN